MRDRSVSVGLTFPMRNEGWAMTFGLLFSLEAGFQHLEFLCERAKLSEHLGSPLPTQRVSTSDQRGLGRHTLEAARLYAVCRLSAISLPSIIGAEALLGFRLVARAQPDDAEDEQTDHDDDDNEDPDNRSEQPRKIRRLNACCQQQERGKQIAHVCVRCNRRTWRQERVRVS